MRKPPLVPGNDDPRHGSENGYKNLGCHCQDCRDAHSVTIAVARAARKSRPIPEGVVHGNNTYCNWACRCPVCRADHARARAMYR